MVMIRCPQKVWEFQHFLSSKDGDPTKLFLIVCRIFGIFAICFEIAALVYFFVVNKISL